ncbi:MAG: hypothetical protein ACREST_10485, partial [Steroidobacteraceae bacterium]
LETAEHGTHLCTGHRRLDAMLAVSAIGESARIGDPSAAQIYFTILNAGTGPAVIHRFEFQYESRIIPADGGTIARFLTACCAGGNPSATSIGSTASTPASQTLLAPNAELTVLRWPLTPENRGLWTALDRARLEGKIGMTACYCSVFDDCWIADTALFPPREVESC